MMLDADIGANMTVGQKGIEIRSGVVLLAAELHYNSRAELYFGHGIVRITRSAEFGIVTLGDDFCRSLLRADPAPAIGPAEMLTPPPKDVRPLVGPYPDFITAFFRLSKVMTETRKPDHIYPVPLHYGSALGWVRTQPVERSVSVHPLRLRSATKRPAWLSGKLEEDRISKLTCLLQFLRAYEAKLIQLRDHHVWADSAEDLADQLAMLAKF